MYGTGHIHFKTQCSWHTKYFQMNANIKRVMGVKIVDSFIT